MVTNFDGTAVELKDYGEFDKNKCRLRFKGVDIDAKNGDDTTKTTIDFPFCVSLIYGEVLGYNCENLDRADAYFQTKAIDQTPAGVVGSVYETASSGTTTIKVSKIPFPLIPGDFIRFGSENKNYTIKNHDESNENYDVITIYETLTEEKSASAAVYLRFCNCENIPILKDRPIDFGRGSFGSKKMCISMELVIEYHHKTTLTADKTIPLLLAFYHGCNE